MSNDNYITEEKSILTPETAIGLKAPNVKEPGIFKNTIIAAGEMISGISHKGREEEEKLASVAEENTEFKIEHPPMVLKDPYDEVSTSSNKTTMIQRENKSPRESDSQNFSKSTPGSDSLIKSMIEAEEESLCVLMEN